MEKIDTKDRNILFELEQDSRQSLHQIGKKVHLSKETVFHRIKRLERRGIIKAYLTEINTYKLGYHYFSMLLDFQNTTPSPEKEIHSYLRGHPFVAWLSEVEGAWDTHLILMARNEAELQDLLEEFLEKYSSFIGAKELFLVTEINYYKKAFWLDKQTMNLTRTGSTAQIVLDPLDLRLLRSLSTNARKPLVQIGKELRLHPKTIAYRIRRMKKQREIQGSRVLVDFVRMGYRFYKVFLSLKNVTKDHLKSLMTYLHLHPSVVWSTKLLGLYDLSIELCVQEAGEFRAFMEELKVKYAGLIKDHETLIIFEESVVDYLPAA